MSGTEDDVSGTEDDVDTPMYEWSSDIKPSGYMDYDESPSSIILLLNYLR
jgi:hypothetical protein